MIPLIEKMRVRHPDQSSIHIQHQRVIASLTSKNTERLIALKKRSKPVLIKTKMINLSEFYRIASHKSVIPDRGGCPRRC